MATAGGIDYTSVSGSVASILAYSYFTLFGNMLFTESLHAVVLLYHAMILISPGLRSAISIVIHKVIRQNRASTSA